MAQNEYLVDGADMTTVADAIREKGGTTAPLSFPAGMAAAVRGIPSGGTDISLGLTAATIGQIAKITAVDTDGKPTAWEAVDVPSGGELRWHLVADLTVAEAVTDVVITEDTEGNTILQYEPIAVGIWVYVPADDTQSSTNGALWVWVNGQNSTSYRSIVTLRDWKTTYKRCGAFTFGTEKAAFTAFTGGAPDMMPLWPEEYGSMFDKITLHVHETGNHIPAGSEIRVLVLGKKPT